jgi:hypothetical protein
VGLGREARHVAYPVPMILAASMGPMPKISVRVVPEASTSASMRSFSSTIFLSSVRILSARFPKLVGGGHATMRAARWAESVALTPPGRSSRRSPCRLP